MESIKLNVFHQEGKQKQLKCIYQGTALYEKFETLIYQDDQSVTKVLWNQKTKQMMILRQSEMRTLLVLNQSGLGTITIDNEFGEMQLKNEVKQIHIGHDRWIVEYDVINGNERMKNRFIWRIKEKQHE